MQAARVLVVDDSAAMRALFSDLLEQSRDITVVGAARDANEAREMIDEVKPNVITLDVEMPGISGIDFLKELMGSKPMPVVMLSSLTQRGANTSLQAYEIGAVECFAKPLQASPEQFSTIVAQLGKVVLAAANSNVTVRHHDLNEAVTPLDPIEWNGKIVAMNASMGGVDALSQMMRIYPANCPPTVVILQTEKELAEAFVGMMDEACQCSVKIAEEGAPLVQGCVYVAADPSKHVIVEKSDPPKLKYLPRDPVEGVRPSANLLYGMLAQTKIPAVGVVLSGLGSDGARGIKILKDSGGTTFAQARDTATVPLSPQAAVEAGGIMHEVDLDNMAAEIMKACSV